MPVCILEVVGFDATSTASASALPIAVTLLVAIPTTKLEALPKPWCAYVYDFMRSFFFYKIEAALASAHC